MKWLLNFPMVCMIGILFTQTISLVYQIVVNLGFERLDSVYANQYIIGLLIQNNQTNLMSYIILVGFLLN